MLVSWSGLPIRPYCAQAYGTPGVSLGLYTREVLSLYYNTFYVLDPLYMVLLSTRMREKSDIKMPCPLSVYAVQDSIAASVGGILHPIHT